jgi:glutamate carboxypeptidase
MNKVMSNTGGIENYLADINVALVRQYLLSKSHEIEDLITEMVEIETPSRDVMAQKPFFDLLTKKLGQQFYTFRIPGKKTGGSFYARFADRRKEQPIQLLLGHSDTVWPKGTLNTIPVIKKENRIQGPGVFDMKAGIGQMLIALKTIRDLNLPISMSPVMLINGDEEIGSHESTPLIRRLSRIAQRAFVMEPPLGLDGKLKTARKGLGRFTLTIRGIAAHAGLDPEQGVSAIMELSYQIQRLFAMNDPQKGISVNVGMIEGGTAANVVAPVSQAVIDVRVLTQEDGVEIASKIHSLTPVNPECKLEISGGMGRPPMEKTERNEKLWSLALAAGAKIGIDLQQTTAGGGSDGNTTSLYTSTLDGLGTVGDGAHANYEFILLDKFYERTLLLILLLTAKPISKQ